MTTDTPDRRVGGGERTIQGFGEVSRTVGRVFQVFLLAATLVGLVALAVLLAYVVNDAVRPLSADPLWYATFAVTFVLPSLVGGVALYVRNRGALWTGLTALVVPVVGLLFGGGASLLFVDIVPAPAWLAYYLAIGLPAGVAAALARPTHTRLGGLLPELSFVAWFAVSLLAFAVSVAAVPGLVLGLPIRPTDGIIVGATLGLPAGLAARRFVSRRWATRRAADLAGLAGFAGPLVAAVVGPLVGVTPVPAAVLAVFVGVPTGLYLADVLAHRPGERVGLLLAVVVVGGGLLGEIVVGQLGAAGPQSWVDWQFLTSGHMNQAAEAGLYPAIAGTAMLMLIVALVAFPVGVGAAVYLEEYAGNSGLPRLIQVNISNLAGVPSVVYGILGLGVFVSYLGEGVPVVPPLVAGALGIEPVYVADELFSAGTVLVGGLTLSLLILPIVIIASQEALRSVPNDMRQASYGMGATRWQTVRNVVLPEAVPGILTGTILALGRAIGETAPLIVIAAPNVFDLPEALDSSVGAMPLQIYAWASVFASEEFWHRAVPAGVVVLLVTLLALNSVAIAIRSKY